MDIRPGHRAVVSRCPTLFIDRFAEAAIERDVRMSLPFEANIRPATQTVTGRNRERIEHIVLVEVNAVVPVAGIEELCSQAKSKWYTTETVCHVLRQTDAVR